MLTTEDSVAREYLVGSKPETHTVFQVFTPTTPARLNFVPRKSVNDQFVNSLRTPGKQVVVYGESGSGKSSLVQRKLEELYESHITTRCHASSTFDSILYDAFDQLDRYYVDSSTKTRGKSKNASFSAEFARIKAGLATQTTETSSSATKRLLPPQLTVQRLGQFLGEEELCWVIEDFHKVPEKEKTPLAQAFKVFSDLSASYSALKIVAIGATETAREVVAYDREMSNRVAEILIPLMTTDELGAIIDSGQSLLNVDMTLIRNDIVDFSVGLASVCHHLALNACLAAGIETTATLPDTLTPVDLQAGLERYLAESSDTMRSTFDGALKRDRVRRFDNCRLILTALAGAPFDGLLNSELLTAIRKEHPDYPQGNLTTYLRQLLSEDRDAIIRKGVNGRFRFKEPLYHVYARASLKPRRPAALFGELSVDSITSRIAGIIERWLFDDTPRRETRAARLLQTGFFVNPSTNQVSNADEDPDP